MIRRPLLTLLTLVGVLWRPLTATGNEAMLFSAPLQPGTAVLLTVPGYPARSQFTGKLGGKPIPFTADGRALIALDMESKPGTVALEVTILSPGGTKTTLGKKLTIPKRTYQVETLTLPEKKVNPDPADTARASEESARIREAYQLRGAHAGYVDGFRMPVTGRFSGVFGSRRLLNGQMRNPHNGVDIAAPEGTPVVVTAPGSVALVGENFFFTGNTLVVDHGHGVISLYAHLHDIRVAPGQWLPAGTIVGTVGMTGRVTGPHLHWGMMVRGERVDPLRLPGIEAQGP
ncbi:MAG: peptidoglycan DD-metalloendopeptidase family protein [Magnetococcales bacterium]|nr:peptidoglycan DD-metalloendopeptidase family protein [Magnetococcales bacterium]